MTAYHHYLVWSTHHSLHCQVSILQTHLRHEQLLRPSLGLHFAHRVCVCVCAWACMQQWSSCPSCQSFTWVNKFYRSPTPQPSGLTLGLGACVHWTETTQFVLKGNGVVSTEMILYNAGASGRQNMTYSGAYTLNVSRLRIIIRYCKQWFVVNMHCEGYYIC